MSDDHGIDDTELRQRLEFLADEGSSVGADTVLAGALTQSSRHRRNRRVAIGVGAAAVVVALIAVSVAVLAGDDGTDGVAVTAAPEPDVLEESVIFRLELDATEVVAGGELEGRLVVENTTGEAVGLTDGTCGSKWRVVLAGDGVPPELSAVFTRECGSPLEFEPGRTELPFSVAASYPFCTAEDTGDLVHSDGMEDVVSGELGDAVTIPVCGPAGTLPPLPVGEYEAMLLLTGEEAGYGTDGVPVIRPDPIAVEVVVPDEAITFSLELDATEVVAGETLGARLVIQNTTGEPLELADANGCGVIWAVNILPIGSEETDPFGVREDDTCRAPNEVDVREKPIRLELPAKQPTCSPPFPTSEWPGDPKLCLAMIPSDLEPGLYEVRVLLDPHVATDSTGRYPVFLPQPTQVTVVARS